MLRMASISRSLGCVLLLLLMAAGAEATSISMSLADFVQQGATTSGGLTFSNASVTIGKGLNKNLKKYTVVVSDAGLLLRGKTNKPGRLELSYDVSGSGLVGISSVLDVKKGKGNGRVLVPGASAIALLDNGAQPGSGSSSFAAAASLQLTQSLHVKQGRRFSFDTTFTTSNAPPSVPEPGIAMLLAAGLTGLTLFGSKR